MGFCLFLLRYFCFFYCFLVLANLNKIYITVKVIGIETKVSKMAVIVSKEDVLTDQEEIDYMYMSIAHEESFTSTCLKKHLGAILVSNEKIDGKPIIAYGHNGPPRQLSNCRKCRRTAKDWEGHSKCRAVHAERRALINMGFSPSSSNKAILYSYMGVPCKDCMLELISGCISEIVVLRETYYDDLSKEIMKEWIEKGGKFRVISDKVKKKLDTKGE